MARKIYDIIPPKRTDEVRESLKKKAPTAVPIKKPAKEQFAQERPVSTPVAAPAPITAAALPPGRKKRFPARELLIGGIIITLMVGVYFFTTLPRAEVTIWPALETLAFEDTVKINTGQEAADFSTSTLPGFFVEQEVSGEQDFPATGIATNNGKARGVITVYNKISPAAPITLKAGTHFLSDSGKYFIASEKIVIPAATKNTPGSIAVKVEAEEIGAESNIGASKFSVPKLAGTSYYYAIWAESTQPMAGGYSGQVKKVTKDDLDGAQDALTKRLFSNAETEMKAKLSEGQVLVEGTMEKTVVRAAASAKADDIVENFHQEATVKISALIFNKSDIEAIITEAIQSQLESGQTFLEKSLEITYSPELIDVKGGTATMKVAVVVKTHQDINAKDVLDLLSRKSSTEVADVVNRLYGSDVSKVEVDFWPFWVKSVPSNSEKVTVNLNFE